MKKKPALIVLCLIIGSLVLSYFLIIPRKSTSSTLSSRAREFISTQKKGDSEVWRNVVTDPKTKSSNQEVLIKDCFVFKVPFVIKNVISDKDCKVTVNLEGSGTITVSVRKEGFASLTESPDVMFRQRHPDEYREKPFVTKSGMSYLRFLRTEEGYEEVGFLMQDEGYLTASLVRSTNEDLTPQFSSLLESLDLL